MAKQRNLFQFQPKYQTQLQYIVIKTADSLIDWLTLNTPVNLEFFLIGSFFHILFLLLFARKYVDKILSLVLMSVISGKIIFAAVYPQRCADCLLFRTDATEWQPLP
jgi:hypothetical protein